MRTLARAPLGTQARGFTVIELMITAAILGILAAIAIPSYQSQMIKVRRTDGQSLLLDIAARQEQFYSDNTTFTNDMTALGFGSDPAASPEGYYRGDAVAGSTGDLATSFVATAQRQGAQMADTQCYDLTLDSEGSRGTDAHADGAVPQECW